MQYESVLVKYSMLEKLPWSELAVSAWWCLGVMCLFSASISCLISCVCLILALFTVWLIFDLNLTSAWMQLAGMERSLHCSRVAAGFSPPFDFVSFLPNCCNHVTYCITVTGCHLSTVCGFSQWDSWWYQSLRNLPPSTFPCMYPVCAFLWMCHTLTLTV